MEESVKQVIQSLRNFLTETKLSTLVNLTVDFDSLKQIEETEQFNKQLTTLANDIQNIAGKDANVKQETGLEQSNSNFMMNLVNSDSDMIPANEKPDVRLDPMLVQISASNKEIEKRIQAFMEKKQLEVDDNNRREFGIHVSSSAPSAEEENNTCARTDAVFKSRSGGMSHVKVSKVVNVLGPQTSAAMAQHITSLMKSPSRNKKPVTNRPPVPTHSSAIEERLRNMESHLKIKRSHGSSEIFERIKSLENRILHLESVSPEYIDTMNTISPNKRRRLNMNPGYQEFSVKEIDDRIQQLQESILKKKLDFNIEPNASNLSIWQ